MPRRTPNGSWPDFARELGHSLERHRHARGLSQEAVAYAAGLSRYTYQKFERGESMPGTPANPSLRNIMALAQVLGVTLDELLPHDWPDLRA
ncbi:helix-turn-helix transcriptional regulator [Herbiconiux sp. KACC 21604]|uniref:helix-turn-helix domain-containing protein n=1 Tax=unclassified Herbiconiux TaxID=2618217 RepID=UPI0014925B63|nr:helix-turn-helix transcriptional regulator [Herbiconiux sp. SALV-R1]QJU52555.1 helix-turn-helix transcriptional regulator [Herbiconiux sp. SALV-R1]WPO87433.1 helix-turn-helix transcriptional regulator [Herbiconiux sp. KACC 21604]